MSKPIAVIEKMRAARRAPATAESPSASIASIAPSTPLVDAVQYEEIAGLVKQVCQFYGTPPQEEAEVLRLALEKPLATEPMFRLMKTDIDRLDRLGIGDLDIESAGRMLADHYRQQGHMNGDSHDEVDRKTEEVRRMSPAAVLRELANALEPEEKPRMRVAAR